MSDLINQLNTLADKLRTEVDDINRGGCCVLATLMYEKLKPIFGRKLRIELWLTGCVDNDEELRESLREWKTNTHSHNNDNLNHQTGVGCNHAYVVFKYNNTKYYFDTDLGAVPYNEVRKVVLYQEYGWDGFPSSVPYKIAKKMADTPIGWNWVFDRSNIAKLRETIYQTQLTV